MLYEVITYVANNAEEAVEKAKQLTAETGTGWHVIKAQIHAGGRGKGGGVKLAKNLDQVKEIAGQIIGMDLITPQTPWSAARPQSLDRVITSVPLLYSKSHSQSQKSYNFV